VTGAIADIRRLVYNLRPRDLEELGLAGALRQRAQQQVGRSSTVRSNFLSMAMLVTGSATDQTRCVHLLVPEILQRWPELGADAHRDAAAAADDSMQLRHQLNPAYPRSSRTTACSSHAR
jgi:hypothetical protein